MHVAENVVLSKYTSLHVGGAARYFISAKTDDDVRAATQFAADKPLPFFVLGKGSNTIFPDTGYTGVIIHMEDRTLTRHGDTITAAAGTFMRQLITFAHNQGLVGIEELAGIPGTVGGAVRGNAGTWSSEIKDYIHTVEALHPNQAGEWTIHTMAAHECAFGYRHSIFKQHPDWVILRATFKLQPGDVAAAKALVLKDLTDRHTKQPYDAPSAGSIFKNLDPDVRQKLSHNHPAGGSAPGKLSVGYLIESCGLKGTKIGGAEISPKHANFIVNRGSATTQNVLDLILLVQKTVKEKYDLKLEPEVVIVP